VSQALDKQGIHLAQKHKRGYDHGVFIPLLLMFPKANIPVIQISLEESLDPARHFMLGTALASLRK
jgi:4,5-DOPA dioxygenase extradiol